MLVRCVLSLHEQGVELKNEAMLVLIPSTHHRRKKSVIRNFREIKSEKRAKNKSECLSRPLFQPLWDDIAAHGLIFGRGERGD